VSGSDTGRSLGNCARVLVPLRRFSERFPDVEITIVAHTFGYFKYLKDGITPEREAELTRQWLDSFGISAPLAVTDTKYWRLPNYDGRRVNERAKNHIQYAFGGTWEDD